MSFICAGTELTETPDDMILVSYLLLENGKHLIFVNYYKMNCYMEKCLQQK